MNTLNTQIYEEASEWLILHRINSLDADARRRFDSWLRESPQHLRAYLEMSTIWEEVPAIHSECNPNTEQLIAEARAEANIVPFTDGPQHSPPSTQHLVAEDPALQSVPVITVPASHSLRNLLAIAALLLVTVGTTWLLYAQRGVYTTDIGEQLTIALADGSSIQLNAQTKLRVHYTAKERSIDLIQGQALFRVAKDASRPFIVDSDGTRVRAVGTQFDIYKKVAGTQITVIEGRVAVASTVPGADVSGVPGLFHTGSATAEETRSDLGSNDAGSSARTDDANSGDSGTGRINATSHGGGISPHSPLEAQFGEVLVSAGEQVLIAQAGPTLRLAPTIETVPSATEMTTPAPAAVPVAANVEAATAWTQQRLVFDFSPLTEVAAEFNRYNRRPLIIEDPTLQTFMISGSFSSTDPTLLLRFLREQPGIVVTETDNEIRIARHTQG